MNTLLTKADIAKLPRLYETGHLETGDKVIAAKLFTPWTCWTWYVIEFDGDDMCFGFVKGHDVEFGYFSLEELSRIEGPFGLKIERDRHFTPTEVGDIPSW